MEGVAIVMADVLIVDIATQQQVLLDSRHDLGNLYQPDRVCPRQGEILVLAGELYRVRDIIYGFQFLDSEISPPESITLIIVQRHAAGAATKSIIRKFMGGVTLDGPPAILQQPEDPSAT
jgi:hypothetical protein